MNIQLSEFQLIWLIPVKIALILIYSMCYAMGGTTGFGGTLVRRILGPSLFIGGLIGILGFIHQLSWNALSFLSMYPPLFLGYGAKTIQMKYIRRFIYGLGLAGSAIIIALCFHSLILGLFQALLCVCSSVYFGVLNPDDAVDEESMIALLSVCLIPFMVV